MPHKVNLAILGASGLVGETMLKILEERNFPINKLYLLTSNQSAGKTATFCGKNYKFIDVAYFDFNQVDIALFSAGNLSAEKYAPCAAKSGCIVIDNSSAFRYQNDIPLIIPEVNSDKIEQYKKTNIIANPNCSTIQMLIALKPIYDAVGIKRINVATYQAASGGGKKGIAELMEQSQHILEGKKCANKVFPGILAFNALPQIDTFLDNGYTKEEMKMVRESQKILDDNTIKVNATAVRVPIINGHSEAINIETVDKISSKAACQLLQKSPGITIMQNPTHYPSAQQHADGCDKVYVGRVREDISHERGLNLWVTADNLRKGAALNAIQIAELLVK